MANNLKYRIQKADRTIKYAGTGNDSWFTLDDARKLVNYSEGERIVECNGTEILWEIL